MSIGTLMRAVARERSRIKETYNFTDAQLDAYLLGAKDAAEESATAYEEKCNQLRYAVSETVEARRVIKDLNHTIHYFFQGQVVAANPQVCEFCPHYNDCNNTAEACHFDVHTPERWHGELEALQAGGIDNVKT